MSAALNPERLLTLSNLLTILNDNPDLFLGGEIDIVGGYNIELFNDGKWYIDLPPKDTGPDEIAFTDNIRTSDDGVVIARRARPGTIKYRDRPSTDDKGCWS